MYCGTQNKIRKNIFEKEHVKIIDEDGWINEIKIWSSAGQVSVKKIEDYIYNTRNLYLSVYCYFLNDQS